MSTSTINSFSSFTFQPKEELQAAILSLPQRQLIQNSMAEVAEQILNLVYDPLNPIKFVQDDAHLKGQLSTFRFILQRDEEAQRALRNLELNSSDPL